MAANRRSPSVGLLGLPTDHASSFRSGAAAGPGALRDALFSPSSNLATEAGPDLAEADFRDLGEVLLTGGDVREMIRAYVEDHLQSVDRLLCVGGDHAVTLPILRALVPTLEKPLTIVQIDAHPDLYDDFEGDRTSHACSFARILEEELATRLVQIGVRTMNDAQRPQAEKWKVEVVPRARWTDVEALKLKPPIYLSLDLDGLDPAFAPGVAHPEAGGLSTREVLDIVWRMPAPVGADVVELNPSLDVGGITAAAGAKCVKEIAGRMLAG